MKTALILMTALVPTSGHCDLIDFALGLGVDRVCVLVNGRTFEPVPVEIRTQALQEHYRFNPKVDIRYDLDDNAPQNPTDHSNFWQWWASKINSRFQNIVGFDYVVASEAYGEQVAESLNASFIPYDIPRSINATRGTQVRFDLHQNWDHMIPEIRSYLMLKATMFGQESVGKTTLSNIVAKRLNSHMIPEWARPYLETVGADLTDQKMVNICLGQSALQYVHQAKALSPVLIQDTDLFSTLGYYRIRQWEHPAHLVTDAVAMASDVYYVLPDSIPVEQDQLRYLGDKRESEMSLWTELLDEYGLPYVLVPDGNIDSKSDFIVKDIETRLDEKFRDIRLFERE